MDGAGRGRGGDGGRVMDKKRRNSHKTEKKELGVPRNGKETKTPTKRGKRRRDSHETEMRRNSHKTEKKETQLPRNGKETKLPQNGKKGDRTPTKRKKEGLDGCGREGEQNLEMLWKKQGDSLVDMKLLNEKKLN